MKKEEIINFVRNKYIEEPENYLINPDDKAIETPDPGLMNLYKDIWNHSRQNIDTKNLHTEIDFEELDEAEEIAEAEEFEEEKVVDIEQLLEVERRVVNILQYLNISLYNQQQLIDIIVSDMKNQLISKTIDNETLLRIDGIIRDLVEHEFKEYEFKKTMFRKALVQELYKSASEDLGKLFEQHKIHRSKRISTTNIANFLNFTYVSLVKKHAVNLKKKKNIGSSDYNYLKSTLKEIIRIKYKKEFNFDYIDRK